MWNKSESFRRKKPLDGEDGMLVEQHLSLLSDLFACCQDGETLGLLDSTARFDLDSFYLRVLKEKHVDSIAQLSG